ncbi:hypothetical protein MZD04_gp042 [Pseudomonas phage Psa21]|uniref:Uncharacterized protein n=1 Tax=Pseudomonas phage Psa21 TaxID=2530023 RepID=A0A481W4H7_9CAUD|nr:hypothetical protein MZD04_gp042 [Pseudomonas phage Psa21]QBJ02572.1 hypothetical protein PSA21_42 [Pseudomonas phage Psa21]
MNNFQYPMAGNVTFTQPSVQDHDNVAVRVSFDAVKIPINKITSILEGISNNTPYPMEELAINTILYECLNEYLQFTLPTIPNGENCSFEYYLDTHFKALANIVNPPVLEGYPMPDKRMMMFINSQWAIAVAELGRQLLPGIRDLNSHNQEVDQIQMFRLDDHKTGMYVLTGISYDQVDAEEGL